MTIRLARCDGKYVISTERSERRNLKNQKSAKFFKKVLHFYFFVVYLQSQTKGKHNRGVAQLASASGLGPEGPVFESQYPDIEKADL